MYLFLRLICSLRAQHCLWLPLNSAGKYDTVPTNLLVADLGALMYILYRETFPQRRDPEQDFPRREYLFKLDARDIDIELEARRLVNWYKLKLVSHSMNQRRGTLTVSNRKAAGKQATQNVGSRQPKKSIGECTASTGHTLLTRDTQWTGYLESSSLRY